MIKHIDIHTKIPNAKALASNDWQYGYNEEYDFVCISKDGTLGSIVEIQNLHIGLPKVPKNKKDILYHDLSKEKQKWRREDTPKGLRRDTEDMYEEYIDQEFDRREFGVWFYNNGTPTYITGSHYFYLQHFKIDIGYPEYREINKWFYWFWEACIADERCYGMCYLKNRRSGFSYMAASEAVNKGTLYRNRHIGIISKTGDDARSFFRTKVGYGFRNLISPFVPLMDGTTNPKEQLNFTEPAQRITKNKKYVETTEGLETIIDYKTTQLNSYDSEKIAPVFVLDECFGRGTKILMSDLSFKNIEDISIGEYVVVEGGKRVRVAATCKGIDNMFLIKQKYNKDYIVNSKHRLYLEQRANSGKYKDDDGIKIMTPLDYLSQPIKYLRRTTYGVRSKGLSFPYKEVDIDPYYLGVWLGDGDKYETSVCVNTETDKEIGDYIEEYAEKIGCFTSKYKVTSTVCSEYYIKGDCSGTGSNPLRNIFKSYNLLENKHIPIDYINNSRDVRLQLLAGVLDSDGHLVNRNGCYRYELGLSNKGLYDEVVFLARTLGIKVNEREKKSNLNTDVWIATLYGDTLSDIPCKVERKIVPIEYKRQYADHINMMDVEPVGIGEYFGITLDADNDDDRRIILEDFTISMNCGKFPKDCKITDYWEVAKTCLEIGIDIVGKAMAGSTSNAMNKGGKEFKELYEGSNVTDRDENGQTLRGLYSLFISAEYNLEGFFDEYGISIVETPEVPVMGNNGRLIKIGSREFLEKRRRGKKKNAKALNEELRKYPMSEREAFMDEIGSTAFNIQKIEEQRAYLDLLRNKQNPVLKGRFEWTDGFGSDVIWTPDSQSYRFKVTWLQEPELRNKKEKRGGSWFPPNGWMGVGGLDPYALDTAAYGGSKGAIYFFNKDNPRAPSNAFVLQYIHRPPAIVDFYEDALKAAIYYGYPILIENSKYEIATHFINWGYGHYLLSRPRISLNPLSKPSPAEMAKKGIPATVEIIRQLDNYTDEYINKYVGYNEDGEIGDGVYFDELLEDWKQYNPQKRTSHDSSVAAAHALYASKIRIDGGYDDGEKKKTPLLRTYKV